VPSCNFVLFFDLYCALRHLHSFPTRRSSDLAAAIGSPRIRAVVSEAGGQGEIWIDGRFICSNRVGNISGEVWRISGLITCVTLHQIKIELSIGNGGPDWNAGKIKLHQNHIGYLVGWPSVEVESGAGNTDVRIDVQESVFTR